MELFEIAVAVLAAFGLYSLFELISFCILYPRRIRRSVRAAAVYDDETYREVAAYVGYLKREQKISPEQLIILEKDDIISEDGKRISNGEAKQYKCKEITDDSGYKDGQKRA